MKHDTLKIVPLLAAGIAPLAIHLIVIASAHAASFDSLAAGEAETFVRFAEGNSPEGIAIHNDAIFVGNRRTTAEGRVSELLKISRDGSVSLLATIDPPATHPAAQGVLGLAIGPQGDVLAAVHTLEPATHGVWRIGSEGDMFRIPGSHAISFPNALTTDAKGNLYVTDSLRFTPSGLSGGIWRFAPDGTGELWIEHPALGPLTLAHPLGIPPVGANGIAFDPPNGLYVANTQRGQIVNIGINPDGTPQAPQVVAGGPTLLTVDGIAADVNGHIHGAVPGFAVLTAIAPFVGLPIPPDGVPPVVEIDPASGSVTRSSLATFDGLFDFPVSLAFDGKSVFATNAAFRGLSPLPIPEPGPSLVEVGVGSPGFPVLGEGLLIGSSTTVPEPATALLLAIGASSAAVCIQRRRREPPRLFAKADMGGGISPRGVVIERRVLPCRQCNLPDDSSRSLCIF